MTASGPYSGSDLGLGKEEARERRESVRRREKMRGGEGEGAMGGGK